MESIYTLALLITLKDVGDVLKFPVNGWVGQVPKDSGMAFSITENEMIIDIWSLQTNFIIKLTSYEQR